MNMQNGHAVVIGGSIGGLLTARVLTNHFAKVTVIERDRFPVTPDFRTGAPQARHAHGLLVRGQQIMESYFPGLTQELWDQGAHAMNMGRDLALYIGNVRVSPFASSLTVTTGSRPLLEHTLRGRVEALPQVQICAGHEVVELRTDAANRRITGLVVRERGRTDDGAATGATTRAGHAPYVLDADLVVDASGRGSRLPEWLGALGYTPPTETVVDAQAGYSTRLYRAPRQSPGWQALYSIPQAPHQSRGCIITVLEGDRWHVTLTGLNGDFPPTDEAGFLEFAMSIPIPEIHAALSQAEPLTAPYGYRRGANRLRHFEKLPAYVEGLLALGDAVYALNPVYGQGMTVAAIGAVKLDECLRIQRARRGGHDLTGLAQRFQQELARVNAGPWQMATGQDMRWPIVAAEHQVDPMSRLIQRYFDRVLGAMTQNGMVAEAFAQVQNMLKSPMSLFHPRIVMATLRTQPAARTMPGISRPAPATLASQLAPQREGMVA